MSKKRIIRKLRINEISTVDKPAQEDALIAIMKNNATPESFKKQAVLTTETDGHTHLLLMDDKTRDSTRQVGNQTINDNQGEGISTPAEDGHTHPWVLTRNGIMIGAVSGHTHEAAAMSMNVQEFNREQEARRKQQASANLQAQSRVGQLSGTRNDQAAPESQAEKGNGMTKISHELHKSHSNAAALMEQIAKKYQREGETYVDTVKRLSWNNTPEAREYCSAARLAEQQHTAANGMQKTETQISKAAATSKLETLARDVQAAFPGMDYYDAYAKAAEENPEIYAKAVAG